MGYYYALHQLLVVCQLDASRQAVSQETSVTGSAKSIAEAELFFRCTPTCLVS